MAIRDPEATRTQRASASGDVAALMETVRQFCPEATVRLERRRGGTGDDFVIFPSLSRPRMLAPIAPRGAAAAATNRYSTALGLWPTIGRFVVSRVLGVVGPGVLTSWRVRVHGGKGGLAGHLGDILGEPVSFALTIGIARANRKPVLQVFDRRGRCIAFVKVGASEESRSLVSAEARALATMAGGLDGFQLPELIGVSEWRNMRLLATTPLVLRPQDPRRLEAIPLHHMASFSLQLGHHSAALAEVPQWQRVRQAAANGAESGLMELVARIERIAEGVPDFVVGSWHGDWTAWNMARSGSMLQLWDFERFEQGAVHGLDAFHYCVNNATLRQGSDAVPVVLSGLKRAVDAVGAGRHTGLLGAVYLATILDRYLRSANLDLGHLIRPRADRMIEALRLWLPTVEGKAARI